MLPSMMNPETAIPVLERSREPTYARPESLRIMTGGDRFFVPGQPGPGSLPEPPEGSPASLLPSVRYSNHTNRAPHHIARHIRLVAAHAHASRDVRHRRLCVLKSIAIVDPPW